MARVVRGRPASTGAGVRSFRARHDRTTGAARPGRPATSRGTDRAARERTPARSRARPRARSDARQPRPEAAGHARQLSLRGRQGLHDQHRQRSLLLAGSRALAGSLRPRSPQLRRSSGHAAVPDPTRSHPPRRQRVQPLRPLLHSVRVLAARHEQRHPERPREHHSTQPSARRSNRAGSTARLQRVDGAVQGAVFSPAQGLLLEPEHGRPLARQRRVQPRSRHRHSDIRSEDYPRPRASLRLLTPACSWARVATRSNRRTPGCSTWAGSRSRHSANSKTTSRATSNA